MVIYDLEKSILIIPDGNIVDNGIWQSGYTSGYTDGARSGSGSSYSDGYNDGIAYQKSLLASTAITSNGNYSRPDGYSSVSVNVPQTGHTDAELEQKYQSGVTAGENAQKAKLVSTAVTSNGTYSRPDGYSSINVNVPQTGHTDAELQQAFNSGYTNGKTEGYNSGYSAGIAYQKSLLVSTAFTENGTYTRENGYSSVNVNVSCSGYPWMATAITLNVPSAITDYGQATATVSPSTATTQLVFACDNTEIAEIDPDTGEITVKSDGTAIIRVTDSLSMLHQSKTVEFHKSVITSYIQATYNVTSTTDPTKILCASTSFVSAESPSGTPIELSSAHTFSTSGLNDVFYYMTGDTLALNTFKDTDDLVKVIVNEGVRTLDDHTFCYCDNLEEVQLPNSLRGTLRCFAENPKLATINIPSGITELGSSCFDGCTSLTNLTIPESVTKLGPACFWGCGSLENITIPESVEEIGGRCFWDCSGLTAMTFEGTTPPAFTALPQYSGVTLGDTAYTFPIYVPCEAVDTYKSVYTTYAHRIMCPSSSAATALTISVPSSITGSGQASVVAEPSTAILDLVYTSSDPTIATIDGNGNITVITAGTVNICVTDRNSGLYDCETVTVTLTSGLDVPLTVEVISGGTILWKANESATPLTIQFSLNEGPWTNITSTTGGTAIAVVAGDVVQFRGNNATYCTGDIENGSNQFLMQTGRYVVRGNIMSMIDSVNFPSMTTFGSGHTGAFASFFQLCTAVLSLGGLILPATDAPDYAYYRMFYGCASASTVPVLPATTLGTSCYESMFVYCRGLTNAPVLPATVLGDYCYKHLFSNTSIAAPPSLPATTLARGCYCAMFDNCKFTTPPSLPATTLAPECYSSMFTACLNLTTAPELPATVMQDSCYEYMFSSCISLNTPPVISSTTLAPSCYAGMFSYCTSLASAPELPATTLANNCYQGMFSNCTNLTRAQTVLPATSLTSYCYSGMYDNCGRLTTVPELPATTLSDYCYFEMFRYCSGLTRGPEILAPVLPAYSCRRMFYGCKNLAYIKCLATDISATYCTRDWVYDVSSAGTFVKDPNTTWGSGFSGIPTNWTIVDAS